MPKFPLTLYSAGTPNGLKISVALSLLKQPYNLHRIQLQQNEQKEPWFLKLNPNGRIPALVDHSNNDFNVFESGAILYYLGEKYDSEGKLLPKQEDLKSQVLQWIMWQMSALGPMLGQLGWFNRSEEKSELAINRFLNESKRLFSVLELQLKEQDYLVNNQLTMADISCFTWARYAERFNISLKDEFPKVQSWIGRIDAIPEVQEGLKAYE